VKEHVEFYSCSSTKDGLCSNCKSCKTEQKNNKKKQNQEQQQSTIQSV
jgi:hypothetical protein